MQEMDDWVHLIIRVVRKAVWEGQGDMGHRLQGRINSKWWVEAFNSKGKKWSQKWPINWKNQEGFGDWKSDNSSGGRGSRAGHGGQTGFRCSEMEQLQMTQGKLDMDMGALSKWKQGHWCFPCSTQTTLFPRASHQNVLLGRNSIID